MYWGEGMHHLCNDHCSDNLQAYPAAFMHPECALHLKISFMTHSGLRHHVLRCPYGANSLYPIPHKYVIQFLMHMYPRL